MPKKCSSSLKSMGLVPKASKMPWFYHSRVFTRCRFQNVTVRAPVVDICRFQHLQAKNVPFSCEWETYSSYFSASWEHGLSSDNLYSLFFFDIDFTSPLDFVFKNELDNREKRKYIYHRLALFAFYQK